MSAYFDEAFNSTLPALHLPIDTAIRLSPPVREGRAKLRRHTTVDYLTQPKPTVQDFPLSSPLRLPLPPLCLTFEQRARRRRACDLCTSRKIRCDGGQPSCGPCTARAVECRYSTRQRSGPKVKGVADAVPSTL